MNARRLIVYLVLNAVVSAAATLSVLWLWDRTHPGVRVPRANGSPTAVATQAALDVMPPAEATLEPTVALPTPTIYTVRAGDTLGTIAQAYAVTIDEIMTANGLSNPNVISVGQPLIIPVAGSLPPTAPPATPSILATNAAEPPRATATRDPSVALPRLNIREVRAPGVLAQEMLTIANSGGPVDLAGWSLRDEGGRQYVFPALTLLEDGSVNVHTATGDNSVTDLYWGLGTPVWAPGKSVLLSDANGNLHARFTVP